LIVTVMHAQARIWPEVAHLMDWGFATERAGAMPVGRLPDPPASPLVDDVQTAKVRAAAAHTRASSGQPLLPASIAAGLGLVAFVVLRRRGRRVRNRLRLDLPL
jgi:D-alanyl-D-alanine carboxypeptidase (penicillin-binding protein 5/6)